MKKIILFILFFGFATGFQSLSAQNTREAAQVIGIGQKTDDGVITAYPNPTKDILLVKSKDASLRVKSVSFYSILGNHVVTYNVNMSAAEINLERLKPGKYLMKYTMSDNTQKVKQIIKQ